MPRLLRHPIVPLLVLSLLVVGAAAPPAARERATRGRERPTAFLVVGDWGRYGEASQRDVARAMARTADSIGVRFVISTGDNFYDNGVTSLDDRHWRESFENVYDQPSLQVPWYVALGNHDHRGDPDVQVRYSKRSKRWRLPAQWYETTERLAGGGTMDVFVLDTNHGVLEYRDDKRHRHLRPTAWPEQLAWLDRELARSRADWRVVVGHHPVRSYASHGPDPEVADVLRPILERHGVALYLNGHEHVLQDVVTNGIHYVTSGAGSRTRKAGRGPDTRFVAGNTSGFAAVTVTRDTLALSFVDSNGHTLHAFRIGRVERRAAPAGARP